MSSHLLQAYLTRYAGEGSAPDPADIEPALHRLHRHATQRWSGFEIDDEEFGRALADVAIRNCQRVPSPLGAEEIYLAIACAQGDPTAMQAFERHYVRSLDPFLADRAGGADRADEVCQRLRTRLLTGDPPAILRYAGQGRLAGFVKVAATRLALNLGRDERRLAARERAVPHDWLADAVDDPEIARIKRQHADVFKQAFEHAVTSLEPRQRTLLRLHLLERLSIDEIGSIYDAHRSTAARWLARARRDVAKRTHERLRRVLGRDEPEFEQLVGLVRSRLDLSLTRVLRSSLSER